MQDDEYRGMYELERTLWWYQGMREITASLLRKNLDGKANPRLLDVGCGTGYSINWLSERFKTADVYGVDLFRQAAELWHLNDIDTAAVAAASWLPFAAEQFDLVTVFDVIYQFSKEDAVMTLSEIWRVLKPGGVLFIREPAYEWLRGGHDVVVATRQRFTATRLRHLLVSQGFRLQRSTYANTILFPAAVPHRLLSRLKGSQESDVQAVSPLLNRVLLMAMKLEARWLSRLSLPFGLSVIMVARK